MRPSILWQGPAATSRRRDGLFIVVHLTSTTSNSPSLSSRSPHRLPSRGNIAAAVIIASSSSPHPLSSRYPPPPFVAASAMTLPSLSSPQPPHHRQMTTSSVAIAMVGGGTMDGGMAATATPSHSHHLESPLCHAPHSHLPPNVDCPILPPPPIAARRRQHPDIIIAPSTCHRPTTAPLR
jgi:hypothetical protein